MGRRMEAVCFQTPFRLPMVVGLPLGIVRIHQTADGGEEEEVNKSPKLNNLVRNLNTIASKVFGYENRAGKPTTFSGGMKATGI